MFQLKAREKIYVFMWLAASLLSCGNVNDTQLERIESLCDSDPRLAISMLDSLERSSFSKKERHYYDLLCIKSRDKAYVRHTSDSLILDVIEYYTLHKDDTHYPVALYYGGRVYSDMGNLPTALKYFQDAIEVIPEDKKNLRFKGNVLSQTGRLLEDLRLYSQANPYIQRSIEISKQLKDSADVFYDYMQLITLNINNDSLRLARKYITEANQYADLMSYEDKVWLKVQLAFLLQNEEKIDSALMVIRPLTLLSDSLCQNYTRGIAADIYRSACILDTAYIYSKELALNSLFNNRISGFKLLFSPEIRPLIPKDSVSYFCEAFAIYMNDYLNKHESQQSLLQNSKFNYSQHERLRKKAEKEKDNILTFSIISILILSLVIIYLKYCNLKNELRLRTAIQLVKNLEYASTKEPIQLHISKTSSSEKFRTQKLLLQASHNNTLKKELLEMLGNLCRDRLAEQKLDTRLCLSPIVGKLRKMISRGKGIGHYDRKTWDEIEKVVLDSSPEFKLRLKTLTLNKLTEKEYQVALLIRCGIIPRDIAILLNRTKSTITDRRTSLAKKIFDSNTDKGNLDTIILRI